mmetsp:Transcript_155256/g.275355  ORF Transcript_155256/g.275355 Transcript_155256/m.275355 type:complete len:410 (+) Transcript_155256:99-1328(+)
MRTVLPKVLAFMACPGHGRQSHELGVLRPGATSDGRELQGALDTFSSSGLIDEVRLAKDTFDSLKACAMLLLMFNRAVAFQVSGNLIKAGTPHSAMPQHQKHRVRIATPPRAQLFPDEPLNQKKAIDRTQALSHAELTGFWRITDPLATADGLQQAAKDGDFDRNMISTNMVLRADNQTSRGSDFPGGRWWTYKDKDTGTARLAMVLKSKRLKQEIHYDGLMYIFEMDVPKPPPVDCSRMSFEERLAESKLAWERMHMQELPGPKVQVTGNWSKYDMRAVKEGGEPVLIETGDHFSMEKLNLDRSKMVATIQPVDPRRQMMRAQAQEELFRQEAKEEEEALEELLKLRDDLIAKHGPDKWQEHLELVEGVHYFKKDNVPDWANPEKGGSGVFGFSPESPDDDDGSQEIR